MDVAHLPKSRPTSLKTIKTNYTEQRAEGSLFGVVLFDLYAITKKFLYKFMTMNLTELNEELYQKIIATLQQLSELIELIDEPHSSRPLEKHGDSLVDEYEENDYTRAIDSKYRGSLCGAIESRDVSSNITRALLKIMLLEGGEETVLLQGFWHETSSITLGDGGRISSKEDFVKHCRSLIDREEKGGIISEEEWAPLTNYFREFRGLEVLDAIDTYDRCIDTHMKFVLEDGSPFVEIVKEKIDAYCDRRKLPSNTLLAPASIGGKSDFTLQERVIFGSYYSLPLDILNTYFQGKLEYKAPPL